MYIKKDAFSHLPPHLQDAFRRCGSIDRSGSVRGMQKIYHWPKGGQVRVGSYVYNVGVEVVRALLARGLLRPVH